MIPLTAEGHSPFRVAVEGRKFDGITDVFAENVVFRSPAVFTSYRGRDAVGGLLGVVATVLGPTLRYAWQAIDGDREVLCFNAVVGGREIEGVDLLHYDAEGRVDELVVMMRPASGLMAMRDAMASALGG